MRNIGFIRHGETEWNTKGLSQGHSDIPLNKAGVLQGERVAHRVPEEPWDISYSSQKKRPEKSAEITTDKSPLPHFSEKQIRERHGRLKEVTTVEQRIYKWGKKWLSLYLQ